MAILKSKLFLFIYEELINTRGRPAMGYAIFTARKLMLTNRINQLNFRIMQLSQQQMTLSNNAAKLERALANQKNVFQTIGNIYQTSLTMQQQAYTSSLFNAAQKDGTVNASTMQQFATLGLNGMFNFATTPLGMMMGMMQQQQEMVNQTKLEQIKDMENQIELERKSLETQLKAAQAEMQEVEKAEENQIKNAAPKFA